MIGYVGVKARKRKRRYIYIVFFIIILFIVVYFGYNIEGEKKEINNEIISTNDTKDLDQLSLDKEELEITIIEKDQYLFLKLLLNLLHLIQHYKNLHQYL